jgi:elongator complex protein 3
VEEPDSGTADAMSLERQLEDGTIRDKNQLRRAKLAASRAMGRDGLATDRELAAQLPAEVRRRFRAILSTKPARSQSGVAVVAVMSSPAGCPHGKCIFCPGGPEVGVPQSYTGFEPSTMRAARLDYDPYKIVRTRLAQLERNGHAIDKVDVVIQGGTFPAREAAYQDWFVAGIFAALNAGPGDGGPWESEGDWRELDAAERSARLQSLQRANESARCRGIGLTIETKPDWCLEPHIDAMLRLGATRVEIGLQALDDEVLRFTNRGHTLDESRRSIQVARDAGFKVCVHLMPGLPRTRRSGAGWDTDAAADVDDFRRLFDGPTWQPDMLKIYPTLVVQEGETGLKRMWERGEYEPYGTATAARVVAEAKAFVPEWCRIQRVDRDIPTTHVVAGVQNSNLRQFVQAELARRGAACRCIRCREAGTRAREGVVVDAYRLSLVRREYDAGGGREVFLAFEDPVADAVAGFLRLRRVSLSAHRPECDVPGGAAFVRELKVYGVSQALGEHADADESVLQHRGLGRQLMAEAERIAFEEWSVGRLLVIAGPGVKPYYRASGYEDVGAYVGKERSSASKVGAAA